MVTRGTIRTAVSLEAMLLAKEKRAQRQTEWSDRYSLPLISLTLVTPGPLKTSARYENIMGVALQVCDQWLRSHGWPVIAREVNWLPTGPEALWCVDHPAPELKAQLIETEQTHPLGRLWDFDVICPVAGPVGRQSLNRHSRRCLVCNEPAACCSRSQCHSRAEVLASVEKIINDWFTRN